MSSAYEVTPKTPETGFSGKLRPDILGISTDSTADSARTAFEASFKGRSDGKTDIQQQKFGGTAIGYIAALNFSVPSGAKQTGEMIWSNFSSPASANRSYFIARNITFAQDQQPAKADMPSRAEAAGGGDQHERNSAKRSPMVSRSWSGFLYFGASPCDGTVSTVSCR